MNVIHTLRTYLGLSQAQLAKMANITQPDLSEMENKPPYGFPGKYQRLSKALGVPLEPLLKNDFTAIPESFFDGRSVPQYEPEPAPTKDDLYLGTAGGTLSSARSGWPGPGPPFLNWSCLTTR